MPRLICVKCQVEFCREQSVYVVEMFNQPPEPYNVWCADLWTCDVCKSEIVSGFASRPIKEHFEDGFTDWLEREKQGCRRIIYDYEKTH